MLSNILEEKVRSELKSFSSGAKLRKATLGGGRWVTCDDLFVGAAPTRAGLADYS